MHYFSQKKLCQSQNKLEKNAIQECFNQTTGCISQMYSLKNLVSSFFLQKSKYVYQKFRLTDLNRPLPLFLQMKFLK